MENPNAVARLMAKRDELHRELKRTRSHEKSVVCSLDHVEATIRLFQPGGMPTRIVKNFTQHRAKKGEVVRLVMRLMREADRPLTSLEVVQEQVRIRGLRPDDATLVIMRKRVGACLTKLVSDGTLRVVPMRGLYQGYELDR